MHRTFEIGTSNHSKIRMDFFKKQLVLPAFWAIFGLATFFLNFLAHQNPEFVERFYSRGFFQIVRCSIDWTVGRLPVPAFYIFWLGVVLFWVFAIRNRPKLDGFFQKTTFWTAKIIGFSGLLLGLFYWVWGFNYARVPIEKQIGIEVKQIDSAMLWQELIFETRTMDSLRFLIVGRDTNALDDERFWPKNAEDTIREAVKKWLFEGNFPINGRVRSRILYPNGLLFKFGTAGIYWPFAGESNLESALHPLRKLPVMAHEMGHGYGFCDEGICNFIEYVALYEHPNPYISYAAHLDYWKTLAANCMENDLEKYDQKFRPSIPAGIRQDVRAIRRQHEKYQEIAPAIRYQVYDSYLKSQNIESGMQNYDEVIKFVVAWRAREK